MQYDFGLGQTLHWTNYEEWLADLDILQHQIWIGGDEFGQMPIAISIIRSDWILQWVI
jgi:hypothetical protein